MRLLKDRTFFTLATAFLASSLLWATVSPAADPVPDEGGVTLDAGTGGTFKLEYPQLLDATNKPVHKLTEQHHEGDTAELKYDGGGEIQIAIKPHGEFELSTTNLPDDVKSMSLACLVAISYAQGGTYKLDGGKAVAFPLEKAKNPHLFQTHAATLAISNADGKSVNFKFPQYTYLDMQDNRQWNWNTFILHAFVPTQADHSEYTFAMSEKVEPGSGGKARPKVDQFGQPIADDFPEKVKSLDELKADVAGEKAYYDGLNPPIRDRFGGLPDSGTALDLKKTGYFHCEEHGGKSILTDPDGNEFFALGVCAYLPADDYTFVGGRREIYQWIPDRTGDLLSAWKADQKDVVSFHLANQIRKYGKAYVEEDYGTRMLARLRKWGFNTVGPFADYTQSLKNASFPYVRGLPMGQWDKHYINPLPGITGTWDPFDDYNRTAIDQNFADKLPAHAADPLLLGYFLSNEPLFEDIPRVVPQLNGKYACKHELVNQLRRKYATIKDFNAAWKMSAGSFEELVDAGLPIHTAAASADVLQFTNLFFETYYKLIYDTFHKYDNHHMLIGNRFQAGTINNESLVKIAGKYNDIISFNYYTYGVDKDFLTRIHQWCNKPMMLTEYFYDSPRDSGLVGGGKDVSSQEERGLAYRNYVEQSASLGFIVGAEWFTLVDQSMTGRWFQKYNGENGNSGLISVADRPWKKALEPMMVTNYSIYDLLADKRAPFALGDGRFAMTGVSKKQLKIPQAASTVRMDGTAAGFPGTPAEQIPASRLVNGSDAGGVESSFKLCWDYQNLYLLFDVTDPTPMMNTHTGSEIWAADCVELFVGTDHLNQSGPVIFSDRHLLISGALLDGKPHWYLTNSESQPNCKVTVIPNVNGKGYVIEAAVPLASLGIKPAVGTEMLFDLGVNDSVDGVRRSRQFMWNGTDRNSGDRTHWGRAVLGQ